MAVDVQIGSIETVIEAQGASDRAALVAEIARLVRAELARDALEAARRDRDTVAAREADEYVRQMEDALVTRLPLGAGMTILTKRSTPAS